MAGATARRMLIEAAAKQWNVPVGELTTSEGVIKHGDNEISYGEIAGAAAKIPVPEEVELKDPKDFKIIGTPRKNVDGLKIITGEPLFGLDTQREGMLIAMIEHPPAFGMKLKSLEAAEAEAMPGIHQVITITTIPEGKENPVVVVEVDLNKRELWKWLGEFRNRIQREMPSMKSTSINN